MTHSPHHDVYDEVADALAALSCDVEAAESHGMLCGMLCSPMPFVPDAWLEHVLGYGDGPNMAALQADHPLPRLVTATVGALHEGDYGLQPLLPAEDASLATRAAALGLWCRGFLSGFGLRGAVPGLTDDAREFLQDIARISQVDPDAANGEAGERDFQEIVEYTRMGALMLYEERLANEASPQPVSRLH